jgi:hypothetical protein
MSVNLIHTVLNDNDEAGESTSERIWKAITAITGDEGTAGLLPLEEATVDQIATLLEGAYLTNGQNVRSYPRDGEEEWSQGSFVYCFGPSLLGEDSFRQVRTLLEQDPNGAKAVALFDLVTELGIQISLNGKDHYIPRMTVTNWPADDVEINRTESNMARMFQVLGLGDTEREHCSSSIPFEVFEKAVNDNGIYTDIPDQLEAFIACAKRNGSTHVYWA